MASANVVKVEFHHAGIRLRNIRERIEHIGVPIHMASALDRSELDIVIFMSIPCKKI